MLLLVLKIEMLSFSMMFFFSFIFSFFVFLLLFPLMNIFVVTKTKLCISLAVFISAMFNPIEEEGFP